MNRYFLCTGLRTLLFFIFLVPIAAGLMAQGFSPQTEAKLQQVLNGFQNDPDHPFVGGMSAAIHVDGLAKWQGATGFASRNIDNNNVLLPGGSVFTIPTPSRIYSITKTLVAALVLELAQEGVFRLSDPVSSFLPLHQINPRLDASVTLSQLLAHESGYSDFLEERNLQIAAAFQPSRVWNAFESISFANQLSVPGETRRYSSTNYIILGAIIETKTGKPIEHFLRHRFFEPLQLSSMYLSGRESAVDRGILAAPHDNISAFNPIFQLTGQPLFPDSYTNISRFPFTAIESLSFTSGGIVSNVSDVANWGNALFNGRATSNKTLNLMLNSIANTPDADGDFLGYGLMRTTKISATDEFVGHDGNAPGYRSVMFYQPDRNLTISILTNFHGADIYAIAKGLYEALPEFLCEKGNGNKNKVSVCWKGKVHCIPSNAADALIRQGGYLGGCVEPAVPITFNRDKSAFTMVERKSNLTVFPNPFRNTTSISFTNTTFGAVDIKLFDINGRMVRQVYKGNLTAPDKPVVRFQSGQLAAGVYYLLLSTVREMVKHKLVISN